METTLEQLLQSPRHSRRHFLKHLDGKPYPQCKSVRETLRHLVWVDRGAEPDWESVERQMLVDTSGLDRDGLVALIQRTHAELMGAIEEQWGPLPLTASVSAFGSPLPVPNAVAYMTSEDFYHSGQVAFIRQATDPDWNYYTAIYS